MPWITRWEMQNYLKTIETNRALKDRLAEMEMTEAAHVPKGLERLVPGISKYVIAEGWGGPQWDTIAIQRDLKRLDTYDDYNAGEILARQLQKEAEL